MTQQVKVLATKAGIEPEFYPRPHLVEVENRLLQVVFSLYMCTVACVCVHTPRHKINECM